MCDWVGWIYGACRELPLLLSHCDLIVFLVGHLSPDQGFALFNPVTSMDCASFAPCVRSVNRGLRFLTSRLKAILRSGHAGGSLSRKSRHEVRRFRPASRYRVAAAFRISTVSQRFGNP
ncbi:hypothetical protein U1Q18_046264 [Sarracenia purpurea var. burkii]